MAFPVLEATATGFTSTPTASHVFDLPSGIVAGDALLVVTQLGGGSPGATTVPDGWHLAWAFGQAGGRLVILWKIADGSEGSTLTVVNAVSTRHVYHTSRWSGTNPYTPFKTNSDAQDEGTQNIDLDPVEGTGSRVTDFTWIAVCGFGGQLAPQTVTAFPTGYTDNQWQEDNGSTGGGANNGWALAFCSKEETAGEQALISGAFALSHIDCYGQSLSIVVVPSHAPVTELSGVTEVFRQEWDTLKAGSGAMEPDDDGGRYRTAAVTGGSDSIDSDYPYIAEAEAVKTISSGGRNVLTCDTSTGSITQDAGVRFHQIGGPPSANVTSTLENWWDASQNRARADYKLTTPMWGVGFSQRMRALGLNRLINGTPSSDQHIMGVMLRISDDGHESASTGRTDRVAIIDFNYLVADMTGGSVSSPDTINVLNQHLRRSEYEDKRISFQFEWRCGTPTLDGSGYIASVAQDGWVRMKIVDLDTDEETILYEYADLPLFMVRRDDQNGATAVNQLSGCQIGASELSAINTIGLPGENELVLIGEEIEEEEPAAFIDGVASTPLGFINITDIDGEETSYAEVDLNDHVDYYGGFSRRPSLTLHGVVLRYQSWTDPIHHDGLSVSYAPQAFTLRTPPALTIEHTVNIPTSRVVTWIDGDVIRFRAWLRWSVRGLAAWLAVRTGMVKYVCGHAKHERVRIVGNARVVVTQAELVGIGLLMNWLTLPSDRSARIRATLGAS